MNQPKKLRLKDKTSGGRKWIRIGSKKRDGEPREENKEDEEEIARDQATTSPASRGNTDHHLQGRSEESGHQNGQTARSLCESTVEPELDVTPTPGAFAVNRNGQVARNQCDGTVTSELETGHSVYSAPVPPPRDDRTILVEAELALPSDNVLRDEDMVYPDLVQTPEDLEREQQRKRKRRCFVIAVIILLIVVILVVGVVFGTITAGESNGDLTPDAEQICDDLLLSEDPNIPLQCNFCAKISQISSEVEQRYEKLKMALNISIADANKTSCEPRNLALLWLSNDTIVRNSTEFPLRVPSGDPEPNFTCPRNDHQRTMQRYVLALLYFSLDGRGWPRQQNRLSSKVECEWEGVSCLFGGHRRVVQLNLAGQNAIGTIPVELGRLCDLRIVDLSVNRIKGQLPAELLRQLTALRVLSVANNNLSGALPDVMVQDGLGIFNETFANFTSVQLIPVGYNKEELELMVAFIDSVLLGGRSPIYDLDFSNNRLVGTFPFGYRLLRYLREVRFDNNDFTGALFPHAPIPILGDMSFFMDLEVFSASNNSLEGSMPRDVGHLTRLEHLDVSYNVLTGTLVTQIGELEELTTLRLGGNRFTGTVPREIINLERIVDLDISSPLLERPLPGELCYQTFLEPPIVVHCNSSLGEECECCCCRCDETEPPCRNSAVAACGSS